MTVRPPTLREKRRYLLVRVEPAGTAIDQKELYYAIADAVTSLWGDAIAAVISQAVVAAEEGHVVIRCRRGSEKELVIALSTITTCRDTRIALRIIAASGTIENLRERIRDAQPEDPVGPGEPAEQEYCFGKNVYAIGNCNGQKVDVIEKGFKNAHRLFLTREDLEKP